MMGQYRVLLTVSCVALFCSGSIAALAQEAPSLLRAAILEDAPPTVIPIKAIEEPVVVIPRKRKRQVDAYAAQGVGEGPFRFYPTLEIGAVVTDNVNSSATTRQADVGLHIKPSLSFQSDWSRHQWRGSMSVDWLRYAATPNLSTLTGSAQTDFRLDILRTTHADFAGSFTANQSGSGNPEVPGTAISPRRDYNFTGSAAITHDFGGLEGQLRAGLIRNSYDDVALSGGGTELNSDRNYIEPSIALRGTYGRFGARLKPYAEISYDPRFHDQVIDRNGQRRNSQGGAILLGMILDDGPIWKGDISANFIARSFDDPALKTVAALGFNGNITWSPTPLWNIVASTGVSLGESAQANISASQNWNLGVQANYALRDNVNLRGGVNTSLTNSVSSFTTTTTASIGADWQLNPNMAVSGTIQSTWFGSTVAGSNYDEQRVMTSLVLRK
jgi:hypothetical protein